MNTHRVSWFASVITVFFFCDSNFDMLPRHCAADVRWSCAGVARFEFSLTDYAFANRSNRCVDLLGKYFLMSASEQSSKLLCALLSAMKWIMMRRKISSSRGFRVSEALQSDWKNNAGFIYRCVPREKSLHLRRPSSPAVTWTWTFT